MRKATATRTVKNNSKYYNCTLKSIELTTCTKISLKLERKETFFRVLGTLSISLVFFPSFSAHKIQGWENKILMTHTKEKSANQKCDFSEPSSLAFPSSLLKVPGVSLRAGQIDRLWGRLCPADFSISSIIDF